MHVDGPWQRADLNTFECESGHWIVKNVRGFLTVCLCSGIRLLLIFRIAEHFLTNIEHAQEVKTQSKILETGYQYTQPILDNELEIQLSRIESE